MEKNTTEQLGAHSMKRLKIRDASETAENDLDALLTADELCRKLKIKKSFIYASCRRKGPDAIPCIMIGKYLRYDLQAVKGWIEKQNQMQDL